MAVNIMTINGKPVYNTYEYFCDFEKDVEKLPTNCAPGSRAYIGENGKVYMIDSFKTWKEIKRWT